MVAQETLSVPPNLTSSLFLPFTIQTLIDPSPLSLTTTIMSNNTDLCCLCESNRDAHHGPINSDDYKDDPSCCPHTFCLPCHRRLKEEGIQKCPVCHYHISGWQAEADLSNDAHDDSQLSDDAWSERLRAVRSPNPFQYTEMTLPLRNGLVSSEDVYTPLSEMSADLHVRTADGLLPTSSSRTIGDWTATRENQQYICIVRLPTGVLKTRGKSLREAYDKARYSYDTDIVDIDELSDCLDESSDDDSISSTCESTNEVVPCPEPQHLMLNGPASNKLDEEDELRTQMQTVMTTVEDLRSTVFALAAELQAVKEIIQGEQQLRERRAIGIDGPSSNTLRRE